MGRLVESACKLALCCDHASQKLAVTVLAKACVLNAAWWESILRTCLQVPMMQHIHSEDAASTLVSKLHIYIWQNMYANFCLSFYENSIQCYSIFKVSNMSFFFSFS